MTDHGDVNHRMGEKWQRAPDIDEEEFDKQEEPIIVNRDYLRDDILETVSTEPRVSTGRKIFEA